MPFSGKTIDKGYLVEYSGTVTADQLFDSQKTAWEHVHWENFRFMIADFSMVSVDQIDFTAADIARASFLDKAASISNPGIKLAFVVHPSIPVESYQAYKGNASEKPWPVELFHSLEEALSWANR